MRALALTRTGDPLSLAVVDLPPPTLDNPGSVRVGVRTVALNHLDLFVARGLPGVPIPHFPHVIGSDAAGIVLEAGTDVKHVRAGDRVVLNPGISCGVCEPCQAKEEVFCKQFSMLGEHRPGTAAEEIVVPGVNVLPIHGEWSWPEAAAFPLSTLTAWRMLNTRARLQRDEQVLIWGIGGGVALAALQVARHLGARVAVTSSSAAKRQRALELGAQWAFDHGEGSDVVAAVKQAFGRGADVIVDSVGSTTWSRTLKALRPGGRMVTCGATTGHEVGLDLRRLFWFQWSLLGSTMGTSHEFAEVVALGDAGHLRPQIDQVFPLAEGARAYQRMADGAQFGKLVLEVTT